MIHRLLLEILLLRGLFLGVHRAALQLVVYEVLVVDEHVLVLGGRGAVLHGLLLAGRVETLNKKRFRKQGEDLYEYFECLTKFARCCAAALLPVKCFGAGP